MFFTTWFTDVLFSLVQNVTILITRSKHSFEMDWNTNVIAFIDVDRGYTALLSNCQSRFSNSTCIVLLKKNTLLKTKAIQ